MFNYLLTVGCPEFLLTHQTTKVLKTFVVSSLYQQNFRPPQVSFKGSYVLETPKLLPSEP